jgi:hypothetical protein
MVPAMHVQNVIPQRQVTQNAHFTRPNVMMPRNGIEALAASNGRMIMPNATANVAGAPRVAVGGDQLQMELEAARIEIDGLNTKMASAGHPFGDQWGLYVQSFNVFFQRNYPMTADRQADAMQTTFKYREGIRQWAYVLAARMAQPSSTTVEGKTNADGFPVLPMLGLVAVIGTAAVALSMAAK